MPVVWDAEQDRKLLLVAMDPDHKPDWNVVALTLGDSVTAEGVRQRYAKLKKEAASLMQGDNTTAAESPKTTTPKTPRKRKVATNDSPSNTPKKARSPRKKKVEDPVGPSNDNAAPAPTKEETTIEENENSVKADGVQEDNEAKADV